MKPTYSLTITSESQAELGAVRLEQLARNKESGLCTVTGVEQVPLTPRLQAEEVHKCRICKTEHIDRLNADTCCEY